VIQHDAGPAGVVPEPGDSLEPTPPADASVTSGSPERRELSFRTSGLSIQLEISGTADSRRLTGQLIPRQSAVVDVRHSAGVITVEADAFGRFSADSIPPGAVSLRCRLGIPISTGWIALLIQHAPRRMVVGAPVLVGVTGVVSRAPPFPLPKRGRSAVEHPLACPKCHRPRRGVRGDAPYTSPSPYASVSPASVPPSCGGSGRRGGGRG
jgi:hypothetical protein